VQEEKIYDLNVHKEELFARVGNSDSGAQLSF
jgi:hypothetical protein